MRTQADRDEDLALGRELERKDAKIARLWAVLLEIATHAPRIYVGQNKADYFCQRKAQLAIAGENGEAAPAKSEEPK
jgi:hypothetical protein